MDVPIKNCVDIFKFTVVGDDLFNRIVKSGDNYINDLNKAMGEYREHYAKRNIKYPIN